jgi:hypothetical protein
MWRIVRAGPGPRGGSPRLGSRVGRAGQREWEVSHHSVGGRLERERGQGTTQVGLMHPDQPPVRGRGVGVEILQRQFIRRAQADDRVGVAMPVGEEGGVREGEVAGGVNRLTGLDTRGKVGAGNQVERALEVRHEHIVQAVRHRAQPVS